MRKGLVPDARKPKTVIKPIDSLKIDTVHLPERSSGGKMVIGKDSVKIGTWPTPESPRTAAIRVSPGHAAARIPPRPAVITVPPFSAKTLYAPRPAATLIPSKPTPESRTTQSELQFKCSYCGLVFRSLLEKQEHEKKCPKNTKTSFENFDQRANQLFNIISTVQKNEKEMESGITRNKN